MKHIEFEFNWKLQIVKINDVHLLSLKLITFIL